MFHLSLTSLLPPIALFCLVCFHLSPTASRFKNLSTYSVVVLNTSLNCLYVLSFCKLSFNFILKCTVYFFRSTGMRDKFWKDWFSFIFSYGTRLNRKVNTLGGFRASCSWPNLSIFEDISFVCGLGYTPEHNVSLFQWHHGPHLEQL